MIKANKKIIKNLIFNEAKILVKNLKCRTDDRNPKQSAGKNDVGFGSLPFADESKIIVLRFLFIK